MIDFAKKKVLVPAALAVIVGLGVVGNGLVSPVSAQPAAADKKPRAKKAGISRKVLQSIADKMGKPITPEMRKDMLAAAQTHADAVKAADEKYAADLAKVTGLTAEDINALLHPQRTPRNKAAAPTAAAAAPAAG